MTLTLPTVSAPPEVVQCCRGFCTEPALVLVHIDYPETADYTAFRWSQPMCAEDLEIEEISAGFSGCVVTTTDLPVNA